MGTGQCCTQGLAHQPSVGPRNAPHRGHKEAAHSLASRGPGAPRLAGSSGPVSAGVLGAVHAAARGVRALTQGCVPILAGKAVRISFAGERPRSSGSASSDEEERSVAQHPSFPSDRIHFGASRGRAAGAVPRPAGAAKRARHPETLWHEAWMETAPRRSDSPSAGGAEHGGPCRRVRAPAGFAFPRSLPRLRQTPFQSAHPYACLP